MDFQFISRLREKHLALRLLHADNAPLVVSFCYQVFVVPNRRSIPLTEIFSSLTDFLDGI